jgi:hypothetical protein
MWEGLGHFMGTDLLLTENSKLILGVPKLQNTRAPEKPDHDRDKA